MKFFLPCIACVMFLSSCSIKPVCKRKNIIYSPAHNLALDVYLPRNIKEPKKILVFVYGGNWVHGKKSIYRFVGKGFARKGVICVVPDYRLSPVTDIAGMAGDVAEAVKWVKENCSSFKGDSNSIYISGHSAGGHLAALVATDNRYFKALNMQNPIKGAILIDAFSLDMYTYLSQSNSIKDTLYLPTFSKEPANWKKYSPLYYLGKDTPPMIQLVGTKTYPAIEQLNGIFYRALRNVQPEAPFISVKGKNHYLMIFQFSNPYARAYTDVLFFMQRTEAAN